MNNSYFGYDFRNNLKIVNLFPFSTNIKKSLTLIDIITFSIQGYLNLLPLIY